MTDTASPLAPLQIVAGLLPSTPRAAAASGRRPGLVGARSCTFGVGLGLGARRRYLGVRSTAAGQSVRPPLEAATGVPVEEFEADETMSPWQISDRMAAPAIRGLLSTQRDIVADARHHRPPLTAATSDRPGRTTSVDRPSRPTTAVVGPVVPVLTESNQIDFAETGHEAGSRGDMLAKLAQLNRLRDGAVPRSNPTPTLSSVPPSSAGLPEPTALQTTQRRSAVHRVVSAAWPTSSSLAAGSSARTKSTSERLDSGSRSMAGSPTLFLSAWEAQPTANWPDMEPGPLAASSAPNAAARTGVLPAAAAALEALRGARPAVTSPAPAVTAHPSQISSDLTVSAAFLAAGIVSDPVVVPASASPWPGDMAAGSLSIAASTNSGQPARSFASTQGVAATSRLDPLVAPAERVRAQLTTDGQVEFGKTGHEHGSRADMLSKLAQLENLRNPAMPAPRHATAPAFALDSPQAASPHALQLAATVDSPVVESVLDSTALAWPSDSPGSGAASSPTSALARAVAPLAAPGPLTAPSPLARLRLASVESGGGSAGNPATDALTGSMSGSTSASMPGWTSASMPAPIASISAALTPAQTIGEAVAPPLAVRFLHELRSRQRVETELLPMAFRPLAEEIVGSAMVTIATGVASRRALGAIGRPAATVGSTIHLAKRPDESTRSQEILAHELTHVAEPSAMPRFFDDPIFSTEERSARRAEKVVRRAIRDSIPPTSASRGRSVGGVVPVVGERPVSGFTESRGAPDVIRRSPAGSNARSAQSLVEEGQGHESTTWSSPSDAAVRRSVPAITSATASSVPPVVRRSPQPTEGASISSAESGLPTMDEIVREVERRLTKKIIGERVRRGQSLRGRI